MTTLAALSLHFPFVWYGFLLLFGLALGSFYNVVIYRLPRMLTQTADDERITLSTPGSSCPQCRQPIAWRDNIPLLSFLWLGRRARCCQAPIAWSYPLSWPPACCLSSPELCWRRACRWRAAWCCSRSC